MPKNPDVDAWLARYANPMKPVVLRVREIILAADPRIGECIKWQAPTFTFDGNLASFYPRSKQHASLMFHQGAKIPGSHPRLEGTGGTSRVIKLASVAEANAARRDLEAIVRAWCAWRSGEPAKAAKAVAKRGATTTKQVASTTERKPTSTKRRMTATSAAATSKRTSTTARRRS